MKEVYEVNTFIKLEGKTEFRQTNWLPEYEYSEEKKKMQEHIFCETFDDLKSAIQLGCLLNSKLSTTLFTGKDVCLIGGDCYDSIKKRITEKNFKPVEIKVEFTPANLTIKQLQTFLTANQYIDYIKSHCSSEKVVDKLLNL